VIVPSVERHYRFSGPASVPCDRPDTKEVCLKRKILVSLLNSGQEFQQMQAADARTTAARLGLDVEVVFAENNAIQQIQQLYKQIHAPEAERPTAIVVEAVSRDGMERLARNALRAGITWVDQQWKTPYLERLRTEDRGAAVHSVSVDEDEIGRIQAQQFRALRPGGGAALFLQGPLGSDTAVRRLQGLEQGLVGSGIVMKAVLNGDWTAESASRAVTSWLRLKTIENVGIDIVGSQNDSMAAGARQAIEQLRREWTRLPFTGCDGLPGGGRQMVAEGQLAATVIKPTTTGPAIELVARRLKGESVPPDLILRAQSHPPLARLGQ
jgi:ABC-type sugar transport system substrate-binding protein